MRQMFSKKQVEELSKLAIAGASNEEKQNFIPQMEKISIEDIHGDLSGCPQFCLVELTGEQIDVIILPSFVNAFIVFDGYDLSWYTSVVAYPSDRNVSIRAEDYVSWSEGEGDFCYVAILGQFAIIGLVDAN